MKRFLIFVAAFALIVGFAVVVTTVLLSTTDAVAYAQGTEIVVDDLDSGFYRNPGGAWYAASCGYNGHIYYTYSTNNPSLSDTWGKWTPNLPSSGAYQVFVHIPCCSAGAYTAKYQVYHSEGSTVVTINQQNSCDEWVLLGTFNFGAGTSGYVKLTDLTDDIVSRPVGFDAMKWTGTAGGQVEGFLADTLQGCGGWGLLDCDYNLIIHTEWIPEFQNIPYCGEVGRDLVYAWVRVEGEEVVLPNGCRVIVPDVITVVNPDSPCTCGETTPTPIPTSTRTPTRTPTSTPTRTPTPTSTPIPCPIGVSPYNDLDARRLEPGDVLMVNASWKLRIAVGWFGGYWGHTAIYAGDGYIVESYGDGILNPEPGVTLQCIDKSPFHFWKAKDWTVLRANTTQAKKNQAVQYTRDQSEDQDPYNWNVLDKWPEDRFFCTQLVWRSYYEGSPRIDIDSDWYWLLCLLHPPPSIYCLLAPSVPPGDIYHDKDLTEVFAKRCPAGDCKRTVLFLGSSANLYITDPQGRHTGVDPATGQIVEEIPNVLYYSGPDEEIEYVVIQDLEGTWDLQVIGTETGTYTLATEVVDQENPATDYVAGTTGPGQITEYQITYPATPGDPVDLIQYSRIYLQADWNLLSLPLILADTSIEAVLSSISGDYDLVYAYDGCDTADPWKRYDVNAPPYANDLTNLDGKTGIWIRITDTPTLIVSGQVPTGTDIQLCEGWNLVGYPSTQAKPITDALSSIEGKYTLVYAYDASDTTDPWKKYDVSAPPYANDLTEMQPGLAYWIKVSDDCVLTVSN